MAAIRFCFMFIGLAAATACVVEDRQLPLLPNDAGGGLGGQNNLGSGSAAGNASSASGGAAGSNPNPETTDPAGGAAGSDSNLETVAPRIVQVSPSADERGVLATRPIVIQFDQAMQARSVETAFSSDQMAVGRFGWNDAGTELSIFPAEPLQYASGIDPTKSDDPQPLAYTFTIAAGAASALGTPLTNSYSQTFYSARRLAMDLPVWLEFTGTTGRYDEGDYLCQSSTDLYVGSFGGGVKRGVVSFSFAQLPSATKLIETAQLSVRLSSGDNNPFLLGPLKLEAASFRRSSAGMTASFDCGSAFETNRAEQYGALFSTWAEQGTTKLIDVTPTVRDAFTKGDALGAQFRFFMASQLDDGVTREVVLYWETLRLKIQYLAP